MSNRIDCGHSFASVLLGVLSALCLALPALAQIPGQFNFQGLLLDENGAPVNQLVDLDFALHSTASGGTALWTESHIDVDVVDGIYSIALGSVTPIASSILAVGSLYLAIVVEGETLSPRQQLLAVPYAIRAETAENALSVNGLSSQVVTQIYEHFSFDGGAPPNDDPSEGLGDPDADGFANFIDPDNDGDGLSDIAELAQSSDINLVTPVITGFSPPTEDGFTASTLQVQGQNFQAGMTVTFGSESPVPTNITPISFDVVVGPQPEGPATVSVTLANGQGDSDSFPFFFFVPVITGFDPPVADGFVTSTVEVQGQNFETGMTVVFGSETPTPTNLTPTSFDVEVGPQGEVTVPVDVTLTNGKTGSANFFFFLLDPVITSFSPATGGTFLPTTVTVTGANFSAGLTVVFGSETPTPTNLTPTSFDVVVGPQPAGFVDVDVTLPNGRSTTAQFEFTGLRRVFVTSATYSGDLGGIAGADAKCNALASAAGKPGTYLAWIADGAQSPATRFNQGFGPYALFDDTVIASNWALLTDGNLSAKINRTEIGGVIGEREVWTNVTGSGTAKGTDHCSGWTSASGNGALGIQNETDSRWTDNPPVGSCAQARRLYCFQE